jgi:hypothetical protein
MAHERTLIEHTPKFETCIGLFQRCDSLVCRADRRGVVVLCGKNLRLDTQRETLEVSGFLLARQRQILADAIHRFIQAAEAQIRLSAMRSEKPQMFAAVIGF